MPGSRHSKFASLHDVELCSHSATGERRAFGELVRRHGSAVRGVLRRMGAQPAEADDVAAKGKGAGGRGALRRAAAEKALRLKEGSS